MATTLDSLFTERHSAMVSYELGPHGQELAKQTLGKVFQKECIRVKSQRLSQGKAQSLVPKWWVKGRVQQSEVDEEAEPVITVLDAKIRILLRKGNQTAQTLFL